MPSVGAWACPLCLYAVSICYVEHANHLPALADLELARLVAALVVVSVGGECRCGGEMRNDPPVAVLTMVE